MGIRYSSFHADTDAASAIRLYASVGWGRAEEYDIDRVAFAIANTPILHLALDGDRLVGITRAFSDGAMVTWIAEVAVDPEYQRRGIGRQLLQRVLQQYGDTAIYAETFLDAGREFLGHVGLRHRTIGEIYSREPHAIPIAMPGGSV
jgi:GNAT superfamily N-acetyltransferase